MLHGIPLQVSLSCPSCHQPVHVQGLGEVEVCTSCNTGVPLPVEQWLGWFGPEEIAEALSLDEGDGRQISSLGGTNAKYAYGHRMPRCQGCHTDVPADQLEALAAAGGHTCTCGQQIRVREAPDLAKIMIPGARWVVNEGATGADATEPKPAAEPMLFQCMACSGALEVDGSARTIECRYCGGSNYLPDGLWLRLHPPRTVRTFFVVADTGEQSEGVPVALLERLAQADDYEVRASAAANPALPVDAMQRLLSDDDSDVRTALAKNPALPVELLERMAKDEDDDIREAVAVNPRTPLDILVALSADEDWEVRRATVQTRRLPDAALAALARKETDSDVLDALEQLDLGPETLRALAAHDRDRVRRIAAAHPDSPADVLVALASDTDSDVVAALEKNPTYVAALSTRRKKRLGFGAILVSVLLCLGAGTGAIGVVAVGARWAMRHLL